MNDNHSTTGGGGGCLLCFLWCRGCFYPIILSRIGVNYKYFLVLNLPNREFCVNLHDYSIYMKLRLLFALVAAVAMMTVVG